MKIGSGHGEKEQFDVKQNKFPIFVEESFQFRYMRYWIEMVYEKLNEKVPELLLTSMNKLDEILVKNQVKLLLKPGEVMICNNHWLAHDRTLFEDAESNRLMWRVWID